MQKKQQKKQRKKTPDLTTYYKAQQGEITLLALTKRANNSKLPSVDVVDLKMELANGNRSMLSYKLHDAIQKNLEEKSQTILKQKGIFNIYNVQRMWLYSKMQKL